MIRRPVGKWNAALQVQECSDLCYIDAVLKHLALDLQAEKLGEEPPGHDVGDCLIIDHGLHIDCGAFGVHMRSASFKVKIGEMFTRFDNLAAARAFIAEVRAVQPSRVVA